MSWSPRRQQCSNSSSGSGDCSQKTRHLANSNGQRSSSVLRHGLTYPEAMLAPEPVSLKIVAEVCWGCWKLSGSMPPNRKTGIMPSKSIHLLPYWVSPTCERRGVAKAPPSSLREREPSSPPAAAEGTSGAMPRHLPFQFYGAGALMVDWCLWMAALELRRPTRNFELAR